MTTGVALVVLMLPVYACLAIVAAKLLTYRHSDALAVAAIEDTGIWGA